MRKVALSVNWHYSFLISSELAIALGNANEDRYKRLGVIPDELAQLVAWGTD